MTRPETKILHGAINEWRVVCTVCGLIGKHDGPNDMFAFARERKEQHVAKHERASVRQRELRKTRRDET
jgi:hypothetical protein